MAQSLPQKIVLKNATKMSLSERFGTIQKVWSKGKETTEVRRTMAGQQQASAKNRRLALQMANRPQAATQAVQAAQKIKQKSLKQRLGVQARLGGGHPGLAGRLGLPRGRGVMQRGRGVMQRGRGVMQLGRGFVQNTGFRGRGARGAIRGTRGTFRGTTRGFRGSGQGVTRGLRRGQSFRGATKGRVGNQQQQRGGGRGGAGRGGVQRGRGGRGGQRGGRAPGASPMTREQLDNELDKYMLQTRSSLDAQLDAYMGEG